MSEYAIVFDGYSWLLKQRFPGCQSFTSAMHITFEDALRDMMTRVGGDQIVVAAAPARAMGWI